MNIVGHFTVTVVWLNGIDVAIKMSVMYIIFMYVVFSFWVRQFHVRYSL